MNRGQSQIKRLIKIMTKRTTQFQMYIFDERLTDHRSFKRK